MSVMGLFMIIYNPILNEVTQKGGELASSCPQRKRKGFFEIVKNLGRPKAKLRKILFCLFTEEFN